VHSTTSPSGVEISAPPYIEARPALAPVYAFAARFHATQRRDVDNAPFILHPLEVGSLLSVRGYDDAVVAAGLLHDVVEKTDATIEAVDEHFGARVAALVAAVTEDDSIAGYTARKAALRAQIADGGLDACAVYVADKLAKTRELRAHATRDAAALAGPVLQQRLEHYEESLRLMHRLAGELPMVDQLGFELWALRALPPA